MAMESPMNIPQRAPRTRSGTEEAMVVVAALLDLGLDSGGLIFPELQQESESGTPVRRRTTIKRSPTSTSKCCIEHHLLALLKIEANFPPLFAHKRTLADGTDQLGRGEDVSCELPPLSLLLFFLLMLPLPRPIIVIK